MKNKAKFLIFSTMFLYSCDVGCFLFVRNYKQKPIKIEVFYFSEEFLSKRQASIKMKDSICFIKEIQDNLKLSAREKCDGYLDVKDIDSNSYYVHLPQKSTLLVRPVLAVSCVNKLIISDSTRNDTIVFWGGNQNYKKYIRRGQLKIKGFFLFKSPYIVDIKNSYLKNEK